MKKSILILGFVFSYVVFASKPRSGINDLADSRGTGVEHVQFVFGGHGQFIQGVDAKDAIQIFRSHVLGQYRCYSANFGGQSRAIGTIYVRATIPAADGGEAIPSQVEVDSKEFEAPDFLDCLKAYWSKVKMPAPTISGAATIVMPIHAQLRQ